MVQLDHHADNWNELPKSLAERLVRFAEDIKPPMEDDDFRSVIEEATRMYSECTCAAVRQHIANKRAETESTAAARNEADLDRAKQIASRQLSRRLRRRLDDTKREQLLNRVADAVGSGRRKPMIDADGF